MKRSGIRGNLANDPRIALRSIRLWRWGFVIWILGHPRHKPKILAQLSRFRREQRWVHLRSPVGVEQFLRTL